MLTNVLKGWRRVWTTPSAAWTTDAQALMDVCERYWSSPCELVFADTGADGLQAQYDRARKELIARSEDAVAWAIGLCALPEPQPRSLGMELLAQAAHTECLGEYEEAALLAFIEETERPLRTRWDQIALESAIGAMGVLGHESALPALVRILQSDDREHQGDTHWNAAAALERITGQPFLGGSKPIEAARLWSRRASS